MIQEMLTSIGKKNGATFASFTHKSKETGEVAKYSVILGASTENLYKKDIPLLERILRMLKTFKAEPHTIKAAEELLASRNESLTKGVGNNSGYTNADTYDYVSGVNGVRVHKETGAVYVSGLLNKKEVLIAGTPRNVVKSAPKTIAKKRIGYLLPSSRYRLFALSNVSRAAINGDVLEIVVSLDNNEVVV